MLLQSQDIWVEVTIGLETVGKNEIKKIIAWFTLHLYTQHSNFIFILRNVTFRH